MLRRGAAAGGKLRAWSASDRQHACQAGAYDYHAEQVQVTFLEHIIHHEYIRFF
jgi:hypothetical protein